ncbi:hypothetical protein QJQ45_020353 [Haematococcus lacustris]|nr:hypothetical protein QJQ45_020353 [Haematococcus lacustris]
MLASRSAIASQPSMLATRPVGRAFSAVQCSAAQSRKEATQERHRRLRRKLSGTEERPRLAVYKSNQHIYAQVCTIRRGIAPAAVKLQKTAFGKDFCCASLQAAAEAVGKKIAELCAAKNITKVCFDRGGNIYHGRVKAVAEAARASGLQF